jgi:hypothetical protein
MSLKDCKALEDGLLALGAGRWEDLQQRVRFKELFCYPQSNYYSQTLKHLMLDVIEVL